MILAELENALVLDKPAGVSTHTPDSGVTDGFVEMASRILDRPLWAVHRLDRDTSGCLLVTTSSQAVESWTAKLQKAKKKYTFVSSRGSQQGVWSFSGRIEKTGNHRFGLVSGEPNSTTTFAKLAQCDLGYLYAAEISTGKTHQIRIHSQATSVPILGDVQYGGDDFWRLMLHSKELEIDGHKVNSPLPKTFDATSQDRSDWHKFQISSDRRRFLMDFYKSETNAWRLIHNEWALKKPKKVQIEKLGEVLQVLNYKDSSLEDEFLKRMAMSVGCKHWFVRKMMNRGGPLEDLSIQQTSPDLPLQWTVQESKMKFDLRYNQGLSSGLFLDQRDHRKKVLQTSQGLRVANFFSYTCGFSVAAALGGAHEVVSVDTSEKSLDWGKNNFRLNGLDPEKYEFFVADTLFFLKSCMKRARQFDLIILDPPTFSRSKLGQFSLKKDLGETVECALLSLGQGGRLLVTTNDEETSSNQLAEILEKSVQASLQRIVRFEKTRPPYDFEFPLERNTAMKGFWIYI